jgi:hypothetical protein
MDAVGRYGGPVRLPRLPLNAEAEEEIRSLTVKLAAIGMNLTSEVTN